MESKLDWISSIRDRKNLEIINSHQRLENEFIESEMKIIPFKRYGGIYFLYQDDMMVYVGISSDITVRLCQHRLQHLKYWNTVKIIQEDDYIRAIEIENYFIDKYHPKYNKAPSVMVNYMISVGDKWRYFAGKRGTVCKNKEGYDYGGNE